MTALPASAPRCWPNPAIPDWDGSIASAYALQVELAQQVLVRDDFPTPLRTVAGFDFGFDAGGAVTRAAAVLLDADTLALIDQQVARVATPMPRLRGLAGFRALPALLQVLAQLPQRPDLALLDGHGIAHPRRLGIAAHFGVAAGLPSIGVATKILVGTAAALHEIRGAHTPLRDRGQQLGWLLRSKPRCHPLVVSPGHRVSMASAAQLAMRFTTHYRLPEPIRLADCLASRRDPAR